MDFMFGKCYNLDYIELSKLCTKNVNRMRHMFGDFYSLTSLDLSSFDTTNVTDMRECFLIVIV